MNMELSKGSKIVIYTILILLCVVCIIPLLIVVSISFSTDMRLITEGYSIFPKGFTLSAYEFVFKDAAAILRSYGISLITTGMGLVLGLILNALLAYVLSRRDYFLHKQITIYLLIPMLLNGGLVSNYIWVSRYLHLKDTIWVMIFPMLISPWYVIMLRTFFKQLPDSLSEAAMIDGAGEMTIFVKIMVPLAKPALATVGMLLVLGYWNDWYTPLLYISDKQLYNLQYRLYVLMADVSMMMKTIAKGMGIGMADIPTESVRMAMCVVAAGPMLLIFPFFQKYLVKGLTVGGVKE